MSRYIETHGRYTIAYGMDHAVGVFVQVFDSESDDPEIPVIDKDRMFDNLTVVEAGLIARDHGAINFMRNLVGDFG